MKAMETETKMTTISFYSYKGGVGRTLLLCNLAACLVHAKKRVFILDCDLEAPGIHHKYDLKPKHESHRLYGFIDYLEAFLSATKKEIANPPAIEDFVHTANKNLFVLPAGAAPETEYIRSLSRMDWYKLLMEDGNEFYKESGQEKESTSLVGVGAPTTHRNVPVDGISILLCLKEQIKEAYKPDYLLVDSRTGVTLIGNFVTRVYADKVICLLQNNTESILGNRQVMRAIRSTSVLNEVNSKIEVVPVLARIPQGSADDEEMIIEDVTRELNRTGEKNEERKTITESSESQAPFGILDSGEKIFVLHQDPIIEVAEEILFGSDRTLRESVLLRDYITLFKHLEPDVLKISKVASLDKYLPCWNNAGERNRIFTGESKRMEDGLKGVENLIKNSNALNYVPVYYHTGAHIKKLVKGMAEDLAKKVDLPPRQIKKGKVNWNYLANQVQSGNYAFCGEPYYLTRFRSLASGIVKIGYVKSFTCFVRKKSRAGESLQKALTSMTKTEQQDHYIAKEGWSEEALTSLIGQIDRDLRKKLKVGTMGETPASDVVPKRLSATIFGDRLEVKPNELILWHWLNEKSPEVEGKFGDENKIIICDHVVAGILNKLAKPHSDDYISFSSALRNGPKFRYEDPIPAGFMYPVEDQGWRRQISNSLAEVLHPSSREKAFNTFSWDKIRSELKRDCVDPLSESALCEELIWDMDLNQAIRWDNLVSSKLKTSK